MAIIELKTPNEFLVRWDDAGNLKGAHIAHRIAYVDDATGDEAFSKFGDPQPVGLGNAALLADISDSINQAALTDNTAKAAQIAQLISERDENARARSEAESARDEAQAMVQQLQAQLSELNPQPVNGVPQVVSRKQGRAALILAGLFSQVQPVIDAIPDATQRALTQNAWDSAQTFERKDPFLLSLGAALGLDDAQLDALFVQAAGM